MSCEDGLSVRQAPKVEVVDLFDEAEINYCVVDIFGINGLRRCFHQQSHAVFEDGHCRDHDKNREQQSADWVNDGQLWLQVDDQCSDDDSETLNHVSNHVNDCSTDIKIFIRCSLALLLLDFFYDWLILNCIVFVRIFFFDLKII